MAGDWLKFEKSTLEKPEVFQMASDLSIDPDAVIGKLLRVWNWFDDQTTDGNAHVTVRALLDRYAGVTGFTKAMETVGWMTCDGTTLEIPKFHRHNGTPAKSRSLGNLRVEKHRKCNAPTVTPSVTEALPEKRREEKSVKTPKPPEGETTEWVGVDPEPSQFASPDMAALKSRINSLKPEWSKPAHWNHSEDRLLFEGTAGQMAELTDSDWKIIGRFLMAKSLDPKDFWRPNNRSMFVKCFPDVFSTAQRWANQNGRAPSRTAQQLPPKQFVPVDRAALAEVFGNSKP